MSNSLRRTWHSLGAVLFAAGIAIQTWLWLRASIDWDQIILLKLGMKLVIDGELATFGKVMSGGGVIPGSFLQLLIAGPLALWFDYRSPSLLVGVTQVLAGLLLYRVVIQGFGLRVGVTFLAVYWLSPWRLFHSGFLWEPNFLLLPAALHLWALWAQRDGPRTGASAVLGLVLLVSPQIHVSGMVLLIITTLWLARRLRYISWPGLSLGAALGATTLIPMAIVGFGRGAWPDFSSEVAGKGILTILPISKAAAYWLRLGSLDVGRRIQKIEEIPWAGEVGRVVLVAIGAASVLVGLLATIWYFKRQPDAGREGTTESQFFRRYVMLSAIGILIAAGLSPATIQGWHTLIVLHAAAIPVTLWVDRFLWTGQPLLRVVIVAFLVLRLPIVGAFGLGNSWYRKPADFEARMRVVDPSAPLDSKPRMMPFGSRNDYEPIFRGIDLWD